MDKIIKNIVSIDKKAFRIKEETDKILINNDKELEKKLKIIEDEILSDARKKSEKDFEKIIEEGRIKANQITKKGEEKYNKLEEIFNKKKPKLQSEIFEKLFIK